MPVNQGSLRTLEVETSAAYLRGLQSMTPSIYKRFTTVIKMNTRTIEAPILSMIGPLREWIGPRLIETLAFNSYAISAKKYEKTVKIPRENVEDDNIGLFINQLETLGRETNALYDQRVMAKLQTGGTDLCYDKLSFFNASHPTGNAAFPTFSNVSGSGNPPWYLLDTTKDIMPMVWGDRTAPEYTQLWSPQDARVFFFDEYVSGVRVRGVADYGFPQCAYQSKAALDATGFENAVVAMGSIVNATGQNMGIRPNLAVIPVSLEPAAKRLWGREKLATGEDNIDYKAIDWVVSPYLSNT
jgi:phage major head subunit gpT-like protein